MAAPLLKGPFTVEAFKRLAESGILREDQRVELIDGQVVEMSPIGDRHASCVRRLNRLFARKLLDVAVIDVQNPVVLGARDAPQPDLVLLEPRADAYREHPRAMDVLLVIEVADTSLQYDRERKIPLYARAGIPEAWVVNLTGDVIEVYRQPSADGYRDVRTVARDGTPTAIRFPGVTMAAAEILG